MEIIEKIWQDYHNKLLNFIKKRVPESVAEDLLQEIFIKVYRQIDTLKEDKKLESWLFQITRNSIIDYYRKDKPAEQLPDWLEQPRKEVHQAIKEEIASCLIPMIDQLPVKYRNALKLSTVEGKKQQEVAKIENISLSGAKSRVQRGREMLKSMLHDCCELEINHKNQIVDCDTRDTNCSCG